MIGPITWLYRYYALRKKKSSVPTRIIPLKDISSATVIVDARANDAVSAIKAVKIFFNYQAIPVRILSTEKSQLNCFGIFKKQIRDSILCPRKEDLFISLVNDTNCFAAEFEARCSTAVFKVGRHQLKGNIFDLVVCPPGGLYASQTAIFSAVKDYLNKID